MGESPMTAAEFCEIQAKLGLNNSELAEALEIRGKGNLSTIVRYRTGLRPLAMRIAPLMRLWAHPDCPPEHRPQPKTKRVPSPA
jgi:hypothetical protein